MEIQDYPNYLIYDDGRVWSKPRKSTIGREVKGRFLKSWKDKKGYHLIALSRDGKSKGFLLSRLVAIHYIPNPDNKPEVDHIDRNPLNNHVSNLRWATKCENMQNRGKLRNNTSGHTGIYYDNSCNGWRFKYQKNGRQFRKFFTTKQEAICYKFFFLLKLKSTDRVDANLTTGL